MAGQSAKVMRLVVAGQHPLTLHGLCHLLATAADCAVLDACNDPKAIVEKVRRHQPDVVVLDLDRNATFTALRHLQHEPHPLRIVVLAGASDRERMLDAVVQLGATVVLAKELPPEMLMASIRKAGREEPPPHTTSEPTRRVTKLKPAPTSARAVSGRLTPRESQIARLAVQGLPTSEIAARLGLKHGTVKIHLHSVYTKLKVQGRLGLIVFARQQSLSGH